MLEKLCYFAFLFSAASREFREDALLASAGFQPWNSDGEF